MAKFNTQLNPPPITVRYKGEEFQLLHKYLTAIERATAVEAIGRGISLAFEIMWESVLSWTGVENDDGTPMAMKRLDGEGKPLRNDLPTIMGQIPWIEQLRVLLVQYAMNGVKLPKARQLLADFVADASELDAIEKELDSFFSTASGGPPKASIA